MVQCQGLGYIEEGSSKMLGQLAISPQAKKVDWAFHAKPSLVEVLQKDEDKFGTPQVSYFPPCSKRVSVFVRLR